jgi:hypothetical protein
MESGHHDFGGAFGSDPFARGACKRFLERAIEDQLEQSRSEGLNVPWRHNQSMNAMGHHVWDTTHR